MAESLLDKIENKDELRKKKQNEAPEEKTKSAAVNRMMAKNGVKDKSVSLKVNSQVYATFTEICKELGLSNNSCLNMIIGQYVRDNKYLLEK